jgi:hypothetical protein
LGKSVERAHGDLRSRGSTSTASDRRGSTFRQPAAPSSYFRPTSGRRPVPRSGSGAGGEVQVDVDPGADLVEMAFDFG